MDERRFMQALFALSIAAVLLLSMVPAIAQAPEMAIVKPLATCADGKCVMEEKDFVALQKFHAERLFVLMQAGEMIDALQAQNAALMQMVTRYAMDCKAKRT